MKLPKMYDFNTVADHCGMEPDGLAKWVRRDYFPSVLPAIDQIKPGSGHGRRRLVSEPTAKACLIMAMLRANHVPACVACDAALHALRSDAASIVVTGSGAPMFDPLRPYCHLILDVERLFNDWPLLNTAGVGDMVH